VGQNLQRHVFHRAIADDAFQQDAGQFLLHFFGQRVEKLNEQVGTSDGGTVGTLAHRAAVIGDQVKNFKDGPFPDEGNDVVLANLHRLFVAPAKIDENE